jgi:uncharacterized protein YjbI with pentapeptide repeats
MATCKIKEISEKYHWVECQQPAWVEDPEGLCLLHSRQKDKDKDSAFTEAVTTKLAREDYDFPAVFFPDKIDLSNYLFKKDANFSNAIFSDDVEFFEATFSGGAYFFGATFSGDAYFAEVTFSGEADFCEATFSGDAEFSEARFLTDSYFSSTKFSAKTYFTRAIFNTYTDFAISNFLGEVLFSWTIFNGKTLFWRAKFSGGAEVSFDSINPIGQPFKAFFNSLKLEFGSRLWLGNLSLEMVVFTDTDLRKIDFHNVEWYRYGGRNVVYDEVRLYEKEVVWFSNVILNKFVYKLKKFSWLSRIYQTIYSEKWVERFAKKSIFVKSLVSIDQATANKPTANDYAQVELVYRYLKLNYENEGNFKQAGDFHYGEMEMHRRASKWRWLPIYWYNLYRFLSGYGERPLRALLVLAGFLVLFTLGFSGAEGNLAPAWPSGRFWEDCLFILQKATFQRPERQPLTSLGHWLATLSPLLLPGQAALFLLALRNRLGRRR